MPLSRPRIQILTAIQIKMKVIVKAKNKKKIIEKIKLKKTKEVRKWKIKLLLQGKKLQKFVETKVEHQ